MLRSAVLMVLLALCPNALIAQQGWITNGMFEDMAAGCRSQEQAQLLDGCRFSQGYFGGALAGIISANNELKGNLTNRMGCRGFAEKRYQELFDEFVDFLKADSNPEARDGNVSDSVIRFLSRRYNCQP
jgi:hypothetical protein